MGGEPDEDVEEPIRTTNQPDVETRPSVLGMSDPIWGPLIHIFVDEKKN